MNKKGFTLIELVSVLVILSVLAVIIFPNILSSISKGKNDLKKDNEKLIISGAKEYVSDNQNNFKSNGNIYCLSVKTLYDKGYINTVIGIDSSDDITLITDVVEVKYVNGKFEYNYVLKESCSGQNI